jgi:peroxiredoxin
MYPHERSLVERLKDEPFTILGVNSDPADNYRDAIERENITWPSFWDGGDTSGPIATKWGVRGWPTIYIIDHEGIIRDKNKRGEEMDKVVDKLLAEMKK